MRRPKNQKSLGRLSLLFYYLFQRLGADVKKPENKPQTIPASAFGQRRFQRSRELVGAGGGFKAAGVAFQKIDDMLCVLTFH